MEVKETSQRQDKDHPDNCYYHMTRDEFMQARDERFSVIVMLEDRYCPEWMPSAIMKAVEYSDARLFGDVAVIMALCIEMRLSCFIRMDVFIPEMIKELNREMDTDGNRERQGIKLSSVCIAFSEIYRETLNLSALEKLQVKLKAEHFEDFDPREPEANGKAGNETKEKAA